MGFLDKLNDFFGNHPRKYSEDGYYKYALKQEELGNIDEAIECYEIILSHDKQHYDSYARLFELYPKRQKWAQMKKMGQQFVSTELHFR